MQLPWLYSIRGTLALYASFPLCLVAVYAASRANAVAINGFSGVAYVLGGEGGIGDTERFAAE